MLIVLVFFTYFYNSANYITLAEQLFNQGNAKIALYYKTYVIEDHGFSYVYLKDGIFSLIESGKLYHKICNSRDYKRVYYIRLKEISETIEKYSNLLKNKHKDKIEILWNPIKKEIQ